ncbi:MAG: dihydroneopterin aldolase [Candidatus Eremiobacteraeota bacterium]|nr:dihydroneopterin aldolase [Candidatus Eremiobacteraeota bacterium]
MDVIRLRGVRAYGRHGASSGERERRQLIRVDLSAEMDLQPAATSDDLARTLDYAELHDRVVRVVATTSYALLERLAADVLDAVFADPRITRARVTLSKPKILGGATPSITLERINSRRA